MKKLNRNLLLITSIIILLTGCSSLNNEREEDSKEDIFDYDPVEYVESIIGSSTTSTYYNEGENVVRVNLSSRSLEYEALERYEDTGRKGGSYLDNTADIYKNMSESISFLTEDETISIQMAYKGSIILEVQNGKTVYKGF